MSAVTVRTAALAVGMLITALSTSALATPINLVTNGDFSAGKTGFTSEYDFVDNNTKAGEYHVRTNSAVWNPYFVDAVDHTGGDGMMMVVNGATDTKIVWGSTVSVDADTDYTFAAFAMNVCCASAYTGPGRTATGALSFYANGQLLATLNVEGPGVWVNGNGGWNSGGATSVNLELRNANLAFSGNDFALDDIFFGQLTAGVQDIDPLATPEPSTWTMLALGGLAATWARRRQSRA